MCANICDKMDQPLHAECNEPVKSTCHIGNIAAVGRN